LCCWVSFDSKRRINFHSKKCISLLNPSVRGDAARRRRLDFAQCCHVLTTAPHVAGDLATWAARQPEQSPVLIYSSDDPASVAAVQQDIGRDTAGALVERVLAATARALVGAGFSRLLVAGGETSGAVVQGLAITALEIGPEIDPGVPWTRTVGDNHLVLALKSGNFGATDFFLKAWEHLS
jgi:3-dehydrotetronate 4-kinase